MVLAGGLALDRENLRHLDNGTTNSNASSTDSSPADCSSSSPYASNSGSDATMNGPRLATSPILELVLDGRPVAVAVRKRGKGLYTQKQHPGSRAAQDDYHNNHEWQHSSSSSSSSSQTGTAEPTTPPGKEGEMWTCIYSMDGTVLATEQEGNLHKDGVPGAHTHTVLTGQTPLVRHLHVLFTAAGNHHGCSDSLSAQLYSVDSVLAELHAFCHKSMPCLVQTRLWTLLRLVCPSCSGSCWWHHAGNIVTGVGACRYCAMQCLDRTLRLACSIVCLCRVGMQAGVLIVR